MSATSEFGQINYPAPHPSVSQNMNMYYTVEK